MTKQQTPKLPIASVRELAFTKPQGGTGMTNWGHDPKLSAPIEVTISRAWYDYEVGYRFAGHACDPHLKNYLRVNAKSEHSEVYFSQFDLVGKTTEAAAERLVLQLASVCTRATTSDGEVFERQQDGSWQSQQCSDWRFPSASDLNAELEVEFRYQPSNPETQQSIDAPRG